MQDGRMNAELPALNIKIPLTHQHARVFTWISRVSRVSNFIHVKSINNLS